MKQYIVRSHWMRECWYVCCNAGALRTCIYMHAQIRGIHKEWKHTPVGYRCGSQFPQEHKRFKQIIYQGKKDYVWAEAKLLNKHWWQSAGTFDSVCV